LSEENIIIVTMARTPNVIGMAKTQIMIMVASLPPHRSNAIPQFVRPEPQTNRASFLSRVYLKSAMAFLSLLP